MFCSPVLPGPLSGSIDSAPPTLEDARLDGMERLHDLSPPELGRKFELLTEQHVYSANMKRVIKGFNLEALQAQAMQSMGIRCTGCYLTDQGGYNTVDILTFDDGPNIIARLSSSHTGQDNAMSSADLEQRFISEASRLRITAVQSMTSAQVATLHYVKKKTTIPVPEWFQLLLDGITALPSDLLDPPESPFALFHDDFNEGNVLVSHSDPTQVVGIIDWEGSRISPVWDPRRLCSVLRHNMVDDPEEFASLKEMQTDILQDAQLYTAYSKLHFARLLQSTRSHLDGLFMEWFDGDGNGVDNKVQSATGETT
ncbi:hypothetical protein B0H17DRAFT_1134753 [Mycena rosella]|uniref:Aminoglycoside phosphotransferase domain-containing protein n=1 Tax=Mycena rosella TaxID=1033263 RepID=A0AAD7DEK8_MYCRO|nr:hypothetical protein B0H17DRAFT_1134753 [Mycena rosella]